jgi:hypothetical protein
MKKPDFFGAGPKIGRIALPWLAATIILAFPSAYPGIMEPPAVPMQLSDHPFNMDLNRGIQGI